MGSGPAGVSVARALVEARVPVQMIDAGDTPISRPPSIRPPLAALRTGAAEAVDYLLGRDLDGLRDMREYSPKLRTATDGDYISGYAPVNRIDLNNFKLIGALARGGLSNIWGAVVSVFDEDDLQGFPVAHGDLLPHYQEIAERIGISGAVDDDDMAGFHGAELKLQPPLPLSPAMQILLENYRQKGGGADFRLGRSRNAVLTEDQDSRLACTEDMTCMWGCHRGAIYNSADEVAELLQMPGFSYQGGVRVRRVTRGNDDYCVHGTDRKGREVQIETRTVVLAAGTLASTRLVLDFLGNTDSPVPVLNSPAMAIALWVPTRFGKPLTPTGYGMAQASFRLTLTDTPGSYAFGLLYAGDSFAAPDLIAHSSLTLRGGIRILRSLLSGLLVGLVYFPSEFSRNQGYLRRDANGDTTLVVEGGFDPTFDRIARRAIRRLTRRFRSVGAWLLPGSAKRYAPGAEVHYGGTLPMGKVTTSDCEVVGAHGLFVVDGSVLPRLPAKHHTFTIMANARRVGKRIAERFLD